MVEFLVSPKTRLAILLLLVGVALAAVISLGGPNRGEIERLVRASGLAAPVVFVSCYAVLTVLLFPGAVITAAGGVLFGALWGTVVTVVGATVGATAAFLVARRLGRDQVGRIIAGTRVERLDAWLEERGFLAVLYLRLVPLVPFNALNYAAGITSVHLRDYLVATALGIIPGSLAFATLGSAIHDPTSPRFLGAVGLIVLLAVGGPLVNRFLRGRGRGAPELSEEGD